jgi:three-Cys-motif partner protein
MPKIEFHSRPYASSTLDKLDIFEQYTQEWFPVFITQSRLTEIHIFDFFCGPGKDSKNNLGSPLRIMRQLKSYADNPVIKWNVPVLVHFFDKDAAKIEQLKTELGKDEWKIDKIRGIDCRRICFQEALQEHKSILSDQGKAKLLLIDQCGVKEVSDEVFGQLISFPVTDFIFFVASAIANRFADSSEINLKIEKPKDSYETHLCVLKHFRDLIPSRKQFFLAPFSLKNLSNIYGLIFGSQHPLGIDKFLRVAWGNAPRSGGANYDIDRENIGVNELMLPFDEMRPKKVQEFGSLLESSIRSGQVTDETDLIRICLNSYMLRGQSKGVIQKLKKEGVIKTDIQTPRIDFWYKPRKIVLCKANERS